MTEDTTAESGIDVEMVTAEVRAIPEPVRDVLVEPMGDGDLVRLSVRSESTNVAVYLGPESVEALQEKLAAESVDPEEI
jgi:hypothetical protein